MTVFVVDLPSDTDLKKKKNQKMLDEHTVAIVTSSNATYIWACENK